MLVELPRGLYSVHAIAATQGVTGAVFVRPSSAPMPDYSVPFTSNRIVASSGTLVTTAEPPGEVEVPEGCDGVYIDNFCDVGSGAGSRYIVTFERISQE